MPCVINHSRKQTDIYAHALKLVAKGVTALCLLRHNLPLTRLMRKSEPPRAILLRNSGGEENRAQKRERLRGFPETHDFFFHQFERKSVNMVNGGRVCEPRPPPRYFYGCGYRSITYSIIAHRGRLVKSLEAIRNRRRRRPRPRRPRRRPKENRFRRP